MRARSTGFAQVVTLAAIVLIVIGVGRLVSASANAVVTLCRDVDELRVRHEPAAGDSRNPGSELSHQYHHVSVRRPGDDFLHYRRPPRDLSGDFDRRRE